MKVEVAVPGSPSLILIVFMVSVDIKQHLKKKKKSLVVLNLDPCFSREHQSETPSTSWFTTSLLQEGAGKRCSGCTALSRPLSSLLQNSASYQWSTLHYGTCSESFIQGQSSHSPTELKTNKRPIIRSVKYLVKLFSLRQSSLNKLRQ